MTLGALTAAGAPLAEVSYRLEALGVPFEFHTENVEASGVRALRITVEHPSQLRRYPTPRGRGRPAQTGHAEGYGCFQAPGGGRGRRAQCSARGCHLS